MKNSHNINLLIQKEEILSKVKYYSDKFWMYNDYIGDRPLAEIKDAAMKNNLNFINSKFILINKKMFYIHCIVNDHMPELSYVYDVFVSSNNEWLRFHYCYFKKQKIESID